MYSAARAPISLTTCTNPAYMAVAVVLVVMVVVVRGLRAAIPPWLAVAEPQAIAPAVVLHRQVLQCHHHQPAHGW